MNQKILNKIDEAIKKKNDQIAKIENKISPLEEKKQILIDDIKSLNDEKTAIRYSKILDVIKGIDGIDDLTPSQIEDTLSKAAQSAVLKQVEV